MSRFVREQPITFIRKIYPEELYDRDTGRPNPVVEEEHVVSVSIQPISGEELDKLGDGYRISDVRVVFSHNSFMENDVVLYRGDRYDIEHEEFWDEGSSPIPHWRYIIVKETVRKDS